MQEKSKKILSAGLGLLSFAAAFVNAHCQELTVYTALTSDYVFRGVSYSDGHAAAQLGLDLSTETGFFGGIWASTTDITSAGRNRPREVDYYLGYVHFFDNDWSTSLSINRYTYPGGDGNVDYDYNELAAVIGLHDRVWFEINYTDSVFGHDEPAYNLEVLANWPLPAALTLTSGIGYFGVSKIAGNGYSYWQMGISRPLGWTTIDLRYHDSNNVPERISPADLADPRLVLTISATF